MNQTDGYLGTVVPMSGRDRAAARQMALAWEAPAFHVTMDIGMKEAMARKAALGCTLTDIVIATTSRALREHPALNAHFVDDSIVRFDQINIGLAVATPVGLTVPVISGADRLDVPGLRDARRDVVERAGARRLKMDDLTGGTFTISNLGMMGIEQFDAILNPPQVAILAVGSLREELRAEHPAEWRPYTKFTLTCDHRALDGATAARFMGSLRDALQD
jgi:pyruvate dehydrogenase E2 component (dihydrolipoamide acetyltransferase)